MSVDDKAIIPVGESDLPIVATNQRHNRSLVPNAAQLGALDHDFHIHGIVPSVAFFDVPESAQDSFYFGRPYVTLKDKFIKPSSPLCNATEQCKIYLLTFQTLLLFCLSVMEDLTTG